MALRFLLLFFSVRGFRQLVPLGVWLERIIGGPSGFHLFRLIVAGILLFAATMKTYALWAADSQPHTYFGLPIWIVKTGVAVEWLVGSWLFIGIFAHAAWVCAIASFAIFLCLSLRASLTGATTCGCFGFLSISPWLMSLMDGSILASIWVFRRSGLAIHDAAGSNYEFRYLVARSGAIALTIFATLVAFTTGILAQANVNRPTASAPIHSLASPFLLAGDPADCSSHCVQRVASIARASLGLDSAWPSEIIPTDPGKLLEVLRDAAHPVGGAVHICPVKDVISKLSAQPIAPVVLVSRDKHLYLLLGAIEVDGKLMCQLLHGDGRPFLVAKNQLLDAGFKEAWKLEGNRDGFLIRIGDSGKLMISSIA